MALLATIGCSQGFDFPAPEKQTAFETFVDSMRRVHALPALAVIVVRHDTTLVRAAVGKRHFDRDDRVSVDDYWQIGSLTKAFTASLIGVAVERGRISWTTTLADAFPALRDSMHEQYRGVTIAQLLSHAGGVPPFTQMAELNRIPTTSGPARQQRRAFIAHILRAPPAFAPGTRHQYSNAGYTIAAAAVEDAMNEPWETLIERDLLAPLKVSVKFGWPAASDASQPWGHMEGLRLVHPSDPHGEYQLPAMLAPAGMLSLTLDGYAAFMRAHLAGLAGSDGVLRSATVKAIHAASPPPPASDTTVAWGFGWGLRRNDWGQVHGHSGSAGTFYCTVQLLSDQDLGLYACTNVGGNRATKGIQAMIEALRARFAEKRR